MGVLAIGVVDRLRVRGIRRMVMAAISISFSTGAAIATTAINIDCDDRSQ